MYFNQHFYSCRLYVVTLAGCNLLLGEIIREWCCARRCRFTWTTIYRKLERRSASSRCCPVNSCSWEADLGPPA